MDEICVAKFDVYECRKSDRASALSGAQLNICAAQTPEFPDTIPTIRILHYVHDGDIEEKRRDDASSSLSRAGERELKDHKSRYKVDIRR